jgi:hypothetical protein
LMSRLVAAYPQPVPYDRLYHQTCGGWACPRSAPKVVMLLRRRLGFGIIETVEGEGYRATSRLFAELGIERAA